MPLSQYSADPRSFWEVSRDHADWLWDRILSGLEQAGRPFHAVTAPVQAIQEGRDPIEAARRGWSGEETADWRDILRQQTQWWSLPSLAGNLYAPFQWAGNWMLDPWLDTGTDYQTAQEQAREAAVQALGTGLNLFADPLNLLDLGIPAAARRAAPAMDWTREHLLRRLVDQEWFDSPTLRSIAMDPTTPEGKAIREAAGDAIRSHRTTVRQLSREMHEIHDRVSDLARDLTRVTVQDPASGRPTNLSEGLLHLWVLDQVDALGPSHQQLARHFDAAVWEAAEATGRSADLMRLAADLQASRIAVLAPLLSHKPASLGGAHLQMVEDLITSAQLQHAESLIRRYGRLAPQPGDIAVSKLPAIADRLVDPSLGHRYIPARLAADLISSVEQVDVHLALQHTSEAKTTLHEMLTEWGLPRIVVGLPDVIGITRWNNPRVGLGIRTFVAASENLVLNVLSGVPAKYREARRLLDQVARGAYEGSIELGGRRYAMADLVREAEDAGVLTGTRRAGYANIFLDARDLREFTPGTPLDPVIMDRFELTTRVAHWLGRISQGMSPRDAAREMRWWLGDVSEIPGRDILIGQGYLGTEGLMWPLYREALPRAFLLAVEGSLLAEPVARTIQSMTGE